jgi:hypothetical protein
LLDSYPISAPKRFEGRINYCFWLTECLIYVKATKFGPLLFSLDSIADSRYIGLNRVEVAMMKTEYGIGRIPADVDPSDEARAEREAQEIVARHLERAPVGYAPTGTTCGQPPREGECCAMCGRPAVGWNSGAGQALCSRHWDSY